MAGIRLLRFMGRGLGHQKFGVLDVEGRTLKLIALVKVGSNSLRAVVLDEKGARCTRQWYRQNAQ